MTGRATLQSALPSSFVHIQTTLSARATGVINAMLSAASSDEDWEAVEQTMVDSLGLSIKMLDSVVDTYNALRAGEAPRYEFLNTLV